MLLGEEGKCDDLLYNCRCYKRGMHQSKLFYIVFMHISGHVTGDSHSWCICRCSANVSDKVLARPKHYLVITKGLKLFGSFTSTDVHALLLLTLARHWGLSMCTSTPLLETINPSRNRERNTERYGGFPRVPTTHHATPQSVTTLTVLSQRIKHQMCLRSQRSFTKWE